MKRKILALVLSFALVATGIIIGTDSVEAADAKVYTLGKTASGTITKSVYYTLVSYSTDTYTFNVNKNMDVVISFTAKTD